MLNVICAIICLMCKRRDDIFSWKAGDAKGDSGWIVAWFFQIFSTTQNMFRNLPGRASSVYLGLTFVLIYALEWCSLFEILELGVSRASRGVNNSAFFKTLFKKPVTPSPSLCFEHLCCIFQLKIKSEKWGNQTVLNSFGMSSSLEIKRTHFLATYMNYLDLNLRLF